MTLKNFDVVNYELKQIIVSDGSTGSAFTYTALVGVGTVAL